jgi:uncharacterized protein (TIRG00374 family)
MVDGCRLGSFKPTARMDGQSIGGRRLAGRISLKKLVGTLHTRNARIIISAGLILILFSRLDVGRVADSLIRVRWELLVAALATFAVSLVLGNVQWKILLSLQNIHLPFRKALSFYFVGAFFNNFLPANIGGDIVRVYDVYRESGRPHETVAATVTDRLFGMVALGLLAMPAGLYVAFRYEALGLDRGFGFWSLVIVLAFMGILAFSVAVLMSRGLARALERVVRPLLIRGTRDRFKQVYEAFHLYRRHFRGLSLVMGTALVVQACRVVVHYEVSEAMGLGIPLIYFFLFVPVIAIFIAMPISIGGLGVREGLGIFFFTRAVGGIGSEQVMAMSLLAYIVGVVVSLGGGVIYFTRGPAPAQIERELTEGRLSDAG